MAAVKLPWSTQPREWQDWWSEDGGVSGATANTNGMRGRGYKTCLSAQQSTARRARDRELLYQWSTKKASQEREKRGASVCCIAEAPLR